MTPRFLLPLIVLLAGIASAQTDLENYFRHAKYGSAVLSPNGKFLATTANINGRFQLAVLDIETGAARNVAGYDRLDVYGIRWISNERIVFNIVDRGGEQTSSRAGLYAINRDGSKSAILMESPEHLRGHMDMATWTSQPRAMRMVGVFNDDRNDIIALGHFPNRDVLPYRVDSLTGRRKELPFNVNGLARGFVFDGKNRLRVVVTTNATESDLTVWYCEPTAGAEAKCAEWRKLSEHTNLAPKFSVLAFDDSDGAMIVSAPASDGRLGVYKYDFANNRPGELLAADKSVDVAGDLVFSPDTDRLLGIRMHTEPPRTVWFDKTMAGLQAGIDKAYPGMLNVIHPGSADAPMLIYSYSSTHPGSYALYFPDKKKVQNLFAVRPWIDPKKMSPKLVYDYAARDGLPIMAYLTLPQGRTPKDLPLIVKVHGGPWSRDLTGFDAEAQFLAGLGYAVLQPQYRGSLGFGPEHFKKSFGQWGLAMQDDLTDGVNSLVMQGVADGRRICIMGTSYGGYAALMGLVKDPDLYRCAVNLLGITDIGYLFAQNRWADEGVGGYFNKQLIGDPGQMSAQFNATSPARQAERIRAPVFMAYGGKDYRVPLIHGEDMRDALKKHKKVYEYLEFEKEEHGFAKEETRFRLNSAIERFLSTYNPAK